MPTSYDIAPTERIPSFHMKGMVRRRFLISYAVPPERLLPFIPPNASLSTYNGKAWVSACFVQMSAMGPSCLPSLMGMGFHYLIHRTRISIPFPDGKKRESVFILEANINRSLLGFWGRHVTGVRFQVREILFIEDNDSWTLQMKKSKETLYQANIAKNSIGSTFVSSSQFKSANEADEFLLGVSYGGEWNPKTKKTTLLAETHEPWKTLVGTCQTQKNTFLESIAPEPIEADHVITMKNIPHYFAYRGITISGAV